MKTITNPILPGFNPDPCICRVGDDYYIATSTFEWFPGVQIHHSRDLVHWRLVGRALDRLSQLDMKGVPHSGGVWAPALSYANGRFWLIYTNVLSFGGPVFDTPNYLVTAESIEGPWSDPVYLHSAGFDPSLFTDDDGSQYLISMEMREESEKGWFNGIILQAYDHATGTLDSEISRIWRGTHLGATEGPHLMRKDGYYYLMTAEGGTGLKHAVSIARSRDIKGPYETAPNNPMLTAHLNPHTPLHSTGHGNFVGTREGEWYFVHLCTRPLLRAGQSPIAYDDDKRFSMHYNAVLGRETAIQRVSWPEGEWPRLAHGGIAPELTPLAPNLPPHPFDEPLYGFRDDFDRPVFSKHFQTLREPADPSWIALDARSRTLRLRGRNSLNSCFEQSLLACRLQNTDAVFETCLSFHGVGFRKSAGLIIYTDRRTYKYLRVTASESGGIRLGVQSALNGSNTWVDRDLESLPDKLWLRLRVDPLHLIFEWSADSCDWQQIGDSYALSELGNWAEGTLGEFTGTFVGMACQDTIHQSAWADFHYFQYMP
jgi:xylan 1,4-beta-xylosidase